jgi:hypothetical protein
MLAISANKVSEIIIRDGSSDLVYRTMEGTHLKKSTSDFVFYQVLNNNPYQLIKVPLKDFVEADYKQAYSPGRQFDEFNTTYKYFIISADGTLNQCQLTERSLMKIFPDRKNLIKNVSRGKSFDSKEAMVTEILRNF